jgi:hypothetical protein
MIRIQQQKKLNRKRPRATKMGEKMRLSVWTQDEAGPYQTKPYPGVSWQKEGPPARQSHEYVRNGTAIIPILFHPLTGQVRVKGVTSSANVVLHPWLKEELRSILQTLLH